MRRPGSPSNLRGRRRECNELDRVLADVRGGRSRVLVLRGEAGIGKSVLLEHLRERASDCRIARAAGVESEMELAFAGLHQLCAPFLDRLSRLPGPQADALHVAFGLRNGDAPDRFVVGLAVLTLLSEVAEQRPLICLVDDAQWLDRTSAQTLAFVARRLAAESVALVFAVREPGDDELTGLPELPVRGLPHDDAHALLASVITGPLDERVRDRIVAETRGNPLALVELPRGLSFEELAGGFGLAATPAVPGRIEESFLRRLETLPDPMRRLLLIAAAEPVGDPLLLWGAAERLGMTRVAADAVETDGLLTIEERVMFRHPLVRSAVYRSAPAQERRAVHSALVEVIDRGVDPDRRAWHLAAAAAGPDEDIAVELERSADRAQARGGLAAAAAFLKRSVALTGDPARRVDRALAAAEASLQAGAFATVPGLLMIAEAEALDDLQRARVDLLRADTASSHDRGGDGPTLLLRAAKVLEPLDPELARRTYLDAWSAALFAGPLASGADLHQVSRQALAAPRPPDPPRASDLLLDGFSLALTEGRRAAAPVLTRAATEFDGPRVGVEEVLRWGWLATAAAVMVWDYETALAVTAREVQVARESGALTVLAVGLNVLAQTVSLGGDLAKAEFLVAEADAVTEATGTRVAPYGALVLAGLRGREGEAVRLIDATVENATAGRQGTAVQYARWAAAMLFNGLGRYERALTAARAACDDTPELFVSALASTELIEAAARTGETELAHATLEHLAGTTRAAPTDWSLGVEARSRALLSAGATADRLYREAIERLSRTRLRPELARAHLLYGEWLRRGNRRAEARTHLGAAYEMAATIRMEAFAERARQELAATGERVRRHRAETIDELTGQEIEIARLAAGGCTNPEIGARLFLSPRTVEWHLRKVFTKLGVASRKELGRALGVPVVDQGVGQGA